jgi:hypothetical protein
MNEQPAGPSDDLLARLSRVHSVRHLDDERPNREDVVAKERLGGPFRPPVEIPRWLWGGPKKTKSPKRSG